MGFAPDSALEQGGFELLVPLRAWCRSPWPNDRESVGPRCRNDPFLRARLRVRIRFAPAGSLRTSVPVATSKSWPAPIRPCRPSNCRPRVHRSASFQGLPPRRQDCGPAFRCAKQWNGLLRRKSRQGLQRCRSQCAGRPLAGRRRSAGAGACGKLSTLGRSKPLLVTPMSAACSKASPFPTIAKPNGRIRRLP